MPLKSLRSFRTTSIHRCTLAPLLPRGQAKVARTLALGVVPVALGMALGTGCGSEDDGTSSATGGTSSSSGGAAGASGGGGTNSAGASGSGNAAECPEVADARSASDTGGTGRVQWIELMPASEAQFDADGADEGVFVAVESFSQTGEAVVHGETTTYEGGEPARFLVVTHVTPDGDISWARSILPATADPQWAPDWNITSLGDGVLVSLATDRELLVDGMAVNEAEEPTLVVARFTESGVDWIETFGAAMPTAQTLASNDSGESVLGLQYEGAIDLGGGEVTCGLVLLRLNASGERTFDRCLSLSGDGFFTIDGLALDSAGDVLASAFPFGSYDVGDGIEMFDATRGGSVLVKLDGADGELVWRRLFRGTYSRSLATDAMDRIYTLGHAPGFDTDPLIADESFAGCPPDEEFDYHLTRLGSDGERLGTVFLNDEGSFDVADSGRAYVVADREGPFADGLEPLALPVIGAIDPDGTVPFVQTLAPEGDGSYFATVTLDGAGNLYSVGYLIGTLEGENGESATADSPQTVVLRLDP